jgi:hypothetical protein
MEEGLAKNSKHEYLNSKQIQISNIKITGGGGLGFRD